MNMACYKPVTHVMFDLDGTLITSDEVYINLLESIAEKNGKRLTSSQKVQLQEKQSLDVFRSIMQELDLPISLRDYCYSLIAELKKPDRGGCKIKPGVEKLITHLHANNIPIAIATNCPNKIYDLSTKTLKDLMDCFHHSVQAPNDTEVENEKPAPDVFLVCARRFSRNPSPEKVLVIDDSYSGVQAAIAAGMQVVLVTDAIPEANSAENATLVLKTLESFQPELFGLPPFPN